MSKAIKKKIEMHKDLTEEKKTPFFTSFFGKPYNIVLTLIILGFIFYLVRLVFVNKGADTTQLKNKVIPELVKKLISDPNIKVEVNNIKDQSGVYEFEMSLSMEGQEARKYTSYITKDGKILFQAGIKTEVLAQAPSQNQATTKCEDLTKTEKPKLTAFVVSECPYGLQIQRVFRKAVDELKDLSSYLRVAYLGSIDNGKITSMHGEKEAQENLRQICIREEQADKYWSYVSCFMKEGKTDECLSTTQINNYQLNACMTDKNKGLKYAQADFDLANKLSISGSPTLVLGDSQKISESGFGGRIPNAVKDIICCASKDKPGFCSQELSKKAIAASFSTTDETEGSAGSVAGCQTN